MPGAAKTSKRFRSIVSVASACVLLAGIVAAGQADGDGDAGPTTAAGSSDAPLAADVVTGAGPGDTTTAGAPGGGDSDTDAGTGATVPGRAPGAGPTAAGPSAPGSPGSPGSPPAKLPVGAGVHGVTDETIEVGMITTDAAAVGGVVTAMSGSQYEQSRSYDRVNQAAVDLVNEMGGIAGRKVTPVYYFYNAGNFFSPASRQQEVQRACAKWTEDNNVFAMYGGAMSEPLIFECAVRSKTPLVHVRYGIMPSQSRFESMSSYWYAPHWFVGDRRERAIASFLVDVGALPRDAKVALMVEDKPDIREAVDRGMKPALAAAGFEVELEIAYPDQVESPWQSYVLQMQSAGITHVIWSSMTTPGFAAVLMLRAAEDQQYRPKWGIGSDTVPAFLVALNAPPDQLANVTAMGWRPFYDVADFEPRSDNGRLCAEQLEEYGQDPADELGHETCEFLLFLRAAFERAPEVSPAGLAAGVAALGDSYPSTMTIGGATRFGTGRHDGTSLVRPVGYDRANNITVYTGDARPVPG